jgi:hypothetical protein
VRSLSGPGWRTAAWPYRWRWLRCSGGIGPAALKWAAFALQDACLTFRWLGYLCSAWQAGAPPNAQSDACGGEDASPCALLVVHGRSGFSKRGRRTHSATAHPPARPAGIDGPASALPSPSPKQAACLKRALLTPPAQVGHQAAADLLPAGLLPPWRRSRSCDSCRCSTPEAGQRRASRGAPLGTPPGVPCAAQRRQRSVPRSGSCGAHCHPTRHPGVHLVAQAECRRSFARRACCKHGCGGASRGGGSLWRGEPSSSRAAAMSWEPAAQEPAAVADLEQRRSAVAAASDRGSVGWQDQLRNPGRFGRQHMLTATQPPSSRSAAQQFRARVPGRAVTPAQLPHAGQICSEEPSRPRLAS